MNNPPGGRDGPLFYPFDFTQQIQINVCISRKIHFMQRIALMFGPARLGEVLNSPNPVILPLINYETNFNVHIFILL